MRRTDSELVNQANYIEGKNTSVSYLSAFKTSLSKQHAHVQSIFANP